MEGKIEVGCIRLWLQDSVIYCKIVNGFYENEMEHNTGKALHDIISIVSKGKYLPLLIDLRGLNFITSIKLFRFLSSSSYIKVSVLSKTFLVDSFALKILLIIQSYAISPIAPDTIFSHCGLSINYCKKKYTMFNSLG
ncbi:hypothetical protein [Flavivirga sp. 57AJ16]|uniref:hypothetical protein n=1 Tax=Flavivirga sp. 57AJ16 TaxID=3025307 RepID=UPI002366AD0E|nr:hypothetical protein [Flavivirga sp. 57AJ16]MDD7886963.1 hypothetical protein [Flavivirga sp. 57AJ16]